MSILRILGKSAAHTGDHTLRLITVAAENRTVGAVWLFIDKVTAFIINIVQIQGINISGILSVCLHTGKAAAFASVTFFSFYDNSFHISSLLFKYSGQHVFP